MDNSRDTREAVTTSFQISRQTHCAMEFLIVIVAFFVMMIGANSDDNSSSYGRFSGSSSTEAANDTDAVDLYYTSIPSYLTDNNVRSLPYIVGLRSSPSGFSNCAGVLIDAKWVLTTNACAPRNNGFFLKYLGIGKMYKDQYAMIGSEISGGSFNGELIKVVLRIPHPDYNKKTRENDYMMLQLERESTATPVQRAHDGEHYMEYDSTGFVFGWPHISDPEAVNQFALLNTTMRWTSDCKNTVDKVYASQFCAAGTKSTDACRVMEGSPIVLKFPNFDFLVGMVSYNPGCGKDSTTPVLFARESKGQEFMTHTMLFYA